jgi:hypothetical protein
VESLFVPLFFVAFPLALALLGAALARRAGSALARRRVLLGFAWTLVGVPLALFLLMLIGESIADMGAGPALAAMGPWLLAAVGFLVLAWIRPALTLALLAGLAAVPLGLGLWSTLDPAGFGAWLDRVGPINLVASQFLVVIAALAARRRPRPAGALIVVITSVPALLPLLAPGAGLRRELVVGALSLPALLAGVLMILAGTPGFVGRASGEGGGPRPGRAGPPEATGRDRERPAGTGPARASSRQPAG